ncbi:unnamed protein product [Gongylonema pulchrum]|uniref:Ovule protein n=1 Tax=Gongylonema pulchrum TaxID=637853 RepID=A0A183EXR9_9BILA|nr:unnamed protein product [Gongylonema pulchrum]
MQHQSRSMAFVCCYQSAEQLLNTVSETVDTVADAILYLEFNILYRGRKYKLLNFAFDDKPQLYLTIMARFSTAIHYFIKIVIYVTQVFFALNRYFACSSPLHYEKVIYLLSVPCAHF